MPAIVKTQKEEPGKTRGQKNPQKIQSTQRANKQGTQEHARKEKDLGLRVQIH